MADTPNGNGEFKGETKANISNIYHLLQTVCDSMDKFHAEMREWRSQHEVAQAQQTAEFHARVLNVEKVCSETIETRKLNGVTVRNFISGLMLMAIPGVISFVYMVFRIIETHGDVLKTK
jgi:hypothetical protein